MITLTINHADGSLYWTEYFNDQSAMTKWLEEEKTRPYWKKDFVTSVIDDTAANEARAAALKKEVDDAKEAKEALKLEVDALRKKPKKNADDLSAIVDKLFDLVTK